MKGLILNVDDGMLEEGSPWRTREVESIQPPVFYLEDGYPVFEVWFWRCGRWWCMTRVHSEERARAGVVQFFGLEQLKGWLTYYGEQPRA